MTTVSIAMATYNGAKYLREQLDSFVAQTRLPDELVISDDASTDDTAAVVEDFTKQAPFAVRLLRNKLNVGFNANFGRAVAACSGDIIFISDQDDVWLPAKIATVLRRFDNPRTLCVVNDQHIANSKMEPTGDTLFGRIKSLHLSTNTLVHGCSTSARREFLAICLPFHDEGGTSYDGWIHSFATVCGTRELFDEPLQIYRRHDSASSNWVATNSRTMGWREVVRMHWPHDEANIWQVELAKERAMLDRFRERRDQFGRLGLGAATYSQALNRFQRRVAAWEHRIAAAQAPRWRRGPAVVRAMLDGNYEHFSGWKSAVKDLVR